MPLDEGTTEHAVERRELHRPAPVALEDKLNAVRAETAGAVIHQNRSRRFRHTAYGLLAAAGRRIPSPRWKKPGSDTGLIPLTAFLPNTACAAALSSASPTPKVTR